MTFYSIKDPELSNHPECTYAFASVKKIVMRSYSGKILFVSSEWVKITELFKSDGLTVFKKGLTFVQVPDNAEVGQLFNTNTQELLPKENLFSILDDVSKATWIRGRRDSLIAIYDPLVLRHRDQLAASQATTLTDDQYQELLTYRQALRDFPANVDLNVDSFDKIAWPTPPAFLTA